MSFGGGAPGIKAITALLAAAPDLSGVADKDWAAAASLIVKKVLVSAGQTRESLLALRAACGDDIFESQLKSLSHHHARQLARRLDKDVPDLEVSTARAAAAFVRAVLAPPPEAEAPATEQPAGEAPEPDAGAEPATDRATDNPETVTTTPGDDQPPSPPTTPNPYFGRKSFRTG